MPRKSKSGSGRKRKFKLREPAIMKVKVPQTGHLSRPISTPGCAWDEFCGAAGLTRNS